MLVCFNCILNYFLLYSSSCRFFLQGQIVKNPHRVGRYIPYAATDYGDILINRENWCFHINGLIVAISEEMDMLWFARSLVNMESSRRLETI